MSIRAFLYAGDRGIAPSGNPAEPPGTPLDASPRDHSVALPRRVLASHGTGENPKSVSRDRGPDQRRIRPRALEAARSATDGAPRGTSPATRRPRRFP